MTPTRIADTRCGVTPPVQGSNCTAENLPANNNQLKTLNPGQTVNVQVSGGLVPATATAAVVQLTATDATATGFLEAFPVGGTQPTASNVNFVPGQDSATRAIVPLGTGGAISVFNNPGGTTDVVVDVVGYFGPGSTANPGALYVPLMPARVADTRPTGQSGAVHLGPNALGPNASSTFPVATLGGIPPEVNGSPTAAFLNVTEATATAASFLTVTPTPIIPPATTSDVNFTTGETRANGDAATLNPADGTLSIYNHVGTTDVLLDAFGYFVTDTTGGTTGTTGGTTTGGTTTGGTTGMSGPPPTNGPNLTSCKILTNGFPNGQQSTVQFVFDKAVNVNTANAANFLMDFELLGFNSTTRTNAATGASVEPNGTTVDVTFPQTANAANFTLCVAQNQSPGAGAVIANNGSGVANPLGSVPLGGSTAINGGTGTVGAGATTAPDLTGASIVGSGSTGQITYTFDKPVGVATANQFFFYTASNPAGVAGTSLASFTPGTNTVTVQFGTTAAPTSTAGAQEEAVNQGAVTGSNGGAPQNPIGSSGTATGLPSLVSVTQVNADQFDFTFTQTPNVTNVGNFVVYQSDNTAIPCTAFTTAAKTVRVTCGVNTQNQNLVLGAVRPAAITGQESGFTNPYGAAPITNTSNGGNTGLTNGPDLLSASRGTGAGSNTVTYTFDKSVFDFMSAAGFFVVDAAGNATFGTTETVQGNNFQVVVTFPSGSVTNAVGAGVTNQVGVEAGQNLNAVRDQNLLPSSVNPPGDVTLP